MRRFSYLLAGVLLLTPLAGSAQEASNVKESSGGEVRRISGMSVVGNEDAPKSLYIVPWKSSKIGVETDLTSSLLNEDMKPVDKPVFMRELDFYQISTED